MKKIVLATGLLVTTLVNAQEAYNKWSLDLGLGASKVYRNPGKATSIYFPHVGVGVRYMTNQYFGVRFQVGYDQFKSKSGVSAANEFKSNYFGFTGEGVLNIGRLLHFEDWTSRIGLLGHFGPGGSFMVSKTPKKSRDMMLHLNGGLTALVRATDRITITADASTNIHMLQNRAFDMRTSLAGQNHGFDGGFLTGSLGVNIALGKNTKHADWIPNDGGLGDEVAALKARVDKIDADMKDDDKDGIANYLDEEKDTPEGTPVDSKGRKVESKLGDMDSDGVKDEEDFCPTIAGSKSAQGCPDADGDGVADFIDACPNEKGTKENHGCAKKANSEMGDASKLPADVRALQFDLGKATIKNKYKKTLDLLAKTMKSNPNFNLVISGHADPTGTEALNNQLSQERADAVKNYLVSKGVDASRLTTQGFGSTKPVASNDTEAGRAQNRRVDFGVK